MRVREAYSWVEDRGKVVRTEDRGTYEKVPWGLVCISAYESGSGKRVLAIWGERVTWSFDHLHLGQWVFSVCCLQLLATEHRTWQCRNGLAASASYSLSRGSQPGWKGKGTGQTPWLCRKDPENGLPWGQAWGAYRILTIGLASNALFQATGSFLYRANIE